ncbi:MAG: hypothetical protein PWQ45_718 [Thermosipho sp. (in: thermotogales)]|nr:hypothetical protein [Thermosipho sp. (in: thermotogales)]
MGDMMKKVVLSNGLEVYYYKIDGIRSVTIAFNVGVGSVYEPTNLLGISHFIEHLSFRGTEKYSMKELKLTVESVGGLLNAWTDKENTVYYAKVPSSMAYETFDVLKEIVFHPVFKKEDLELEREIIYHEYLSNKEEPLNNLYELMFQEGIDGPHSKPVIGFEETIKSIGLDDIKEFHGEFYNPYNVKVIIVGHLPEEIFGKILEELEKIKRPGERTIKHKSIIKHGIIRRKIMKNANQVHILYVTDGFSLQETDRYAAIVLNTILSSGMSSYFFEEIREKEGLVYDIYTSNLAHKNWGIFNIYAATSIEKVQKFHEKMLNSINNFNLTDELFEYGIKRLIGKLELSTENTSTLTTLIIEYISNEVEPELPNDIVSKIKNITKDNVNSVFEKLFSSKWSLFYVANENIDYFDKLGGVKFDYLEKR